MSERVRLPNRRKAITEDIAVGNLRVTVTVGFAADGRPLEVFLSGAKHGTGLAALLADAAVAISVALQCGLRAAQLGKSVGRLPEIVDGPAVLPASPIGAVLDLIAVTITITE